MIPSLARELKSFLTCSARPDRRMKMIAMAEQIESSERETYTAADPKLTVASLEGVKKNYGDIRALRGVDFRLRAGEVVALLGPNGAGKTTAVKLLLGLIQENSGRV